MIYSFVKWYDSGGWLLGSENFGFPNIKFIVGLFLSSIAFGYLTIAWHSLKTTLGGMSANLNFLIPDPGSIWKKINSNKVSDWAIVYLNDGAIYSGKIGDYSSVPDEKDQDFLLVFAESVDVELKTQYNIDGIGVYLNTRDVKRIEFLKAEEDNERNPAPQKWYERHLPTITNIIRKLFLKKQFPITFQ